MGAYTGPNQVRDTGHSLALNQPGVIHPTRQLAPKQFQRFMTGSVPVILPRPAMVTQPGSPGQDQPPPLGRGRQ